MDHKIRKRNRYTKRQPLSNAATIFVLDMKPSPNITALHQSPFQSLVQCCVLQGLGVGESRSSPAFRLFLGIMLAGSRTVEFECGGTMFLLLMGMNGFTGGWHWVTARIAVFAGPSELAKKRSLRPALVTQCYRGKDIRPQINCPEILNTVLVVLTIYFF